MTKHIDLNGKVFTPLTSQQTGDVGAETLFYYHQKDTYLWAHYFGGSVAAGVLIGRVLPNNRLKFTYRHYDVNGALKEGECETRVEIMDNGLTRLEESWKWTKGGVGSGQSTLIEKRN